LPSTFEPGTLFNEIFVVVKELSNNRETNVAVYLCRKLNDFVTSNKSEEMKHEEVFTCPELHKVVESSEEQETLVVLKIFASF